MPKTNVRSADRQEAAKNEAEDILTETPEGDAIKRKRGRPRKIRPAEFGAPQAFAETPAHGTNKPARKRGRPRKEPSTESETSTKLREATKREESLAVRRHSRGSRPVKEAIGQSNEEVPVRKRGRPRKSVSHTLSVSVMPLAQEEVRETKKRGRPRKASRQPEGDDIRVVDSSLVSVASAVVPDEPPAPIVRGRPKKPIPPPAVMVAPEATVPQTDTKVGVDWMHNVPGPTPPAENDSTEARINQSVSALVDRVSDELFPESLLFDELINGIDLDKAPTIEKALVSSVSAQLAENEEPWSVTRDETQAETSDGILSVTISNGEPVSLESEPANSELEIQLVAPENESSSAWSNVRNEFIANEEVELSSAALALPNPDSGLLKRLVTKVDALIIDAVRNNDARRRMALLQASSAQSRKRIEELLHRQAELVQAFTDRQLKLAEEAREREQRQAQEQLAYEREQTRLRLEQQQKQSEEIIAHERQLADQLRAQELHRLRLESERERERTEERLAAQRAENARLQAEAEMYKNYAANDKQFLTAPFMDAAPRAVQVEDSSLASGVDVASPFGEIVAAPLEPSPETAIKFLAESFEGRKRQRRREVGDKGAKLQRLVRRSAVELPKTSKSKRAAGKTGEKRSGKSNSRRGSKAA